MLKTPLKILLLPLLIMISTACNSTTDGTVCFAIFISIGIEVADQAGTPVELDELTIIISRTGKEVDLCKSEPSFCGESGIAGNPEFGQYMIFHDGLRSEIFGPAMGIIVSGKKGDVEFQRLYMIGDNGCNVELLSGDTQVILEI